MEALARGTVSGLIEAATEKLPLDNLLKIASSPVGKKAIWNILEQMGTEATEEAVSYVANYIADAAAKDPNAEFSLKDMMLSALGGGLSGGIMGAGGVVVGYARNGNVNSQAAQPAQESAFTRQAGTDANAAQSAAQAGSIGFRKSPESQRTQGAIPIREQVDHLPRENYKIPRLETPHSIFLDENGSALPVSKYPSAIRKYMNRIFKGKVLDIGSDGKVYISKSGIEEFSFPARRIGESERAAKYTAGASLDTTLEPAVFLINTPDDGRHPKATGGWDNYYVMFETDDGIYSGIVKTMQTNRGREFYDISEIQKESAQATRGDNEIDSPPAMPDASLNPTLPQQAKGVNTSIPNAGSENSRQPGLRSTNPDVQAMMDAQGRIRVARRTQRVFDRLGEKLGVNIIVDAHGNGENGYYDSQTRTIHLNADSKDPLGQVFSHEITHRLKETSPADYLAFAQLAEEQLRRTGEYDSLASRIRDAYGELSPDALADEMVAHYAQSLVTNIDEFERLAGINRNLAQKLLDWLDEILHQARLSLQGLTVDEQNEIFRRYTFNEVADATKAWKEVLRRAGTGAQGQGSVRHSVMLDADQKPYVVVDADILQGVPKSQWVKTVKNTFKRMYPDGIDMGFFRVKQNADSRNEYTNSKYTQKLRSKNAALYRKKMRMVNNLGEIVQNAYGTRNEGLKHPRNDNYQSFNHGTIDVRIGAQDYNVQVVTAIDGYNNEVFYDIVGIQPTKITEAAVQANSLYKDATSADPRLPQMEPGVNPHSMQEGRKYSRPLVLETIGEKAKRRGDSPDEYPFKGIAENHSTVWGMNNYSYRCTNEPQVSSSYAGYGMFADNPSEAMMYGKDMYAVRHSDLVDIDDLKPRLIEIWNQAKEDGYIPPEFRVYEDESDEYIGEMFDPLEIVDGAGAWDIPEFISWFYDFGAFDDIKGIKTRDGAIVFAEYQDIAKKINKDSEILAEELENPRLEKIETEEPLLPPEPQKSLNPGYIAYMDEMAQKYGAENMWHEMDDREFGRAEGRKYSRPLARDAEYRDAVASGDAETARRLLEEKAAQKGYTAGAEWRMSHRAPGNDGFSQSIDDVREMFGGEQIYSRRAEQLYGEGRDYDWKAIRVIQQMRGKPDADVTVYRAVPKSVKDSRLRKGDWVTTVREYAQEHGGREFSENGGYRVIAETVKARDLYTDGNSIFEWGYDPEGEFAYQNTRNNVKRLEPTYDDEGELIPLSQRFNSRKTDERYSRTLAPELAEEHGTIEPGEHPANDVLLPRKDGSGSPVRRTYRTAAESRHADERMQAEVEQVIRDGAASYQVSGDREAADYAGATLSREGFDGARGRWNAALESGKTNKNDIALGERLYVEAANRGDYQAAREILAQVAAEATIAGQKVQAIRLIKRMGPAGELLTLEQTVRKIQKEIEPKVKKLQKNSSEQIESLKKSVVELENELKPVEKKLEQAKQALDAARAERNRILSLEKSAERKSETANKRASEIGERLPGLQESADRAQATWEQAKQALDAARAERDWLKKRIKSYNNRNATTTNLANELEPKLGELWKQLAEAESSYQKAAEDYEVTREILKQAQKRLASVKNRTESLNRREYSDWWNIQAINEKTEAAKQRYREAVEQFEDTRQKRRALEEMKKRINQLEGKISIPQSVVDDILSQKTQKSLDEAMTRAYAEIGKQVPSNWADKWNAWRYMAMLVNPTTHIRNITGNLFFRPAIALKDAIKIPMERALMPRYKGDPTAAFLTGSQTDKGYLAQGRESFEENRRMLMSSGKYNPSNEIRDNMRIFQNGVLEAIRRKNGGALEAEDLVFMRRSYVRAYAQVLKANDYAAQDGARQAEIRKQAESWAAEEAWRATYRDASAAADAISRFSRINAATSVVTEGLLPFKKTPINVAKRGLSYSPAGLVKGLYDMTYGVKSGKVDAAHAIDQFASGLSGTAIVALGAYLASQGLLNGAGDDDDKARAYRKQVSGYQQYSLQIGDKSYTIDWLAPSSMPLFVGAELWKLKQGEAASFKGFYEAMKTLPSPMVEMSMLSSLEDAIDAASYGRSGGEKFMNAFGDTVGSYFGQAVPTLGGKINRIIDGTQRNAYYKDKTALVPSDWTVAYNSTIRQKVPGMSKGLEPKLDVWGREQKEGLGERIAENLVSPGYLSHNKETPVDKEILRLYEKTGESSVIPNTSPNKYFPAKNNLPRYDMSAAEYTAYMRVRGTTSYELINQMISSSAYKKMGDEEKAKMIGELYQYAGEIAKRRIAPEYADKGMDKAIEICTKAKLTYGQYLAVRSQADADGNNSVSQEEAKKAIDASGISRKQKSAMWQSFNSKWKNNPYQ